MDILTHIILGACIGEVIAGKKLGKKNTLVIGAFAQCIPDFDIVSSLWLSPANNVLAHRGFTHSILFALLISLFLGTLFQRWYHTKKMSSQNWILFFLTQVLVHILIDTFNVYGTGWFEPFSHDRISFNALFVADLFYSIPLAVCFLILLYLKEENTQRKVLSSIGLLISSLYLCYALSNKIKIDLQTKQSLSLHNISQQHYFSTPTPLNTWLWYIVAQDSTGYFIGYHSILNPTKEINFTFYPQQDSLLTPYQNHDDVQKLLRFSKGFYTVEQWGDTLVYNDLRFGLIQGWQRPQARFAFHYFLNKEIDNKMVMQRGRFAGWNKESVTALMKKIQE